MAAVAHTPRSNQSAPRVRKHAGGGGGRRNAQAQTRDDAPAPSKAAKAGGGEMRERRDIVSGEIMPEARLIRFVAAPDGAVVPDVAASLPGRGLWVSASKAAIAKAVEKKLFSRAAKAQLHADGDLAERAEQALVRRMTGDLGLARRSGGLVLGFDNVERALDAPRPPAVLIAASDGAADGKRKLRGMARRREPHIAVIECLTSAELGLALGRENVIHAAIQAGGLATRLILDAERLKGFRPEGSPARNERDS
jgi:predicted RNA-binding protein YlxR (DUF448 family)